MPVVAITGAGQGIGRAVAYHFGAHGYAVAVADMDEAAAQKTVETLRKSGVRALSHRVDVAIAADVERWTQSILQEFGCPDVLVNNAGTGCWRPFLELAETDFNRVIGVNLKGTFLCTQRFARAMVQNGTRGAVINIASTRAFMSEPNTESYSASKGGIVALTHATAISLGGFGIRVNCISPGWIEVRDWRTSPRAETPVHSEEDRKQHPVGRVGKPEDIAAACLFLAEQAGFMTGQNITIDGGMTVKMIYAE